MSLSDKLPKFFGVVLQAGSEVDEVAVGDKVIFARYAGAEMGEDGCVLMNIDDIQVKIVPTKEEG